MVKSPGGSQGVSLGGSQWDYSTCDLDVIRSICASIESSFQKYDTYPKSVTSRAVEWYQTKPIQRQPDARVSPVLIRRSDLSEALLFDEPIKFCEIAMAQVLAVYAVRKEISPTVSKRYGDATRQNMSVLDSALNALGLSNAKAMTTGGIKIALRAPDCDLERGTQLRTLRVFRTSHIIWKGCLSRGRMRSSPVRSR